VDIGKLAQTPKLVPICLDSDKIINTYGDIVEFWCWDRVSATDFIEINMLTEHSDSNLVYSIMSKFILDELDSDGMPVLTDGVTLPMDILVAAMEQISDRLGKF